MASLAEEPLRKVLAPAFYYCLARADLQIGGGRIRGEVLAPASYYRVPFADLVDWGLCESVRAMQ